MKKIRSRLIIGAILYIIKICIPILFPNSKNRDKISQIVEALAIPLYDIANCFLTDSESDITKDCEKYETLV